MSAGLSADQVKLRKRKKGFKLCLLVSESNSCRSAYRFSKAFLVPGMDELHLVTVIMSESGRASALARQREVLEAEVMDCARYHAVVKEEEYTLPESLGRYIATSIRPHIIFMGSTNLCTNITPGQSSRATIAVTRASNPTSGGGSATTASMSSSAQMPMMRRVSTPSARNASAISAMSPSVMAAATSSSSSGGATNSGLGTLGTTSLALKILPELRCAPVLLVKYNSKGPWLAANSGSSSSSSSLASAVAAAAASSMPAISPTLFPNSSRPASAAVSRSTSMRQSVPGAGGGSSNGGAAAGSSSNGGAAAGRTSGSGAASGGGGGGGGGSVGWPMRVMVDLQPNSRHVLEWLFENFTPGHDHLFLTVSQAFDGQHQVKPVAQRLLTAFSVQAAVNSFEADKSVLAGPANKSLPQAVMETEPDVLVVQMPRCRGVPGSMVELLYSAKTSFLIWPPDYISPAPS